MIPFTDPSMSDMLARTALKNYYQGEVELNDFFQKMDGFEISDLQDEDKRIRKFASNVSKEKKIWSKTKKIKSNCCRTPCLGTVGLLAGLVSALVIGTVLKTFLSHPHEYGIDRSTEGTDDLMSTILIVGSFTGLVFGLIKGCKTVQLSTGEIESKLHILELRRFRLEDKIKYIKHEIANHHLDAINELNKDSKKSMVDLRIVYIHFEKLLTNYYKMNNIEYKSIVNEDPSLISLYYKKTPSYLKAIESDPQQAKNYYKLTHVLRKGEAIKVPGLGFMLKKELYLHAIRLNSNYIDAYTGLANILKEEEIILLPDGRKMNKLQIIQEIIRLSPSNVLPPADENILQEEVTHESEVTDSTAPCKWNLTYHFLQSAQPSELKSFLPSTLANLFSITNHLCEIALLIDIDFNDALNNYREILEKSNSISQESNKIQIESKEIKRKLKAIELIEQRFEVIKETLINSDEDNNFINGENREELKQLDALMNVFSPESPLKIYDMLVSEYLT